MRIVKTDTASPRLVLAVYKSGDHDYYIESHQVINGKVYAGKPLEQKSLRQMAKVVLNKDTHSQIAFRGICPENLLSFSMSNGMRKILWHVPPRKMQMYFTNDLGIPNGKAQQPHLIFFVSGKTLQIFAIKEQIVTPNVKLYLAPFHNISIDGKVCLGTIRVKHYQYIDDCMNHWEEIFYNSYFSHAGSLHGTLTFNINAFWKNLIESQCEFPTDMLIPCRPIKSVGNLLSLVTDKNNAAEYED